MAKSGHTEWGHLGINMFFINVRCCIKHLWHKQWFLVIKSRYSPTTFQDLTDHINERNRSAQLAQRESQLLFQTLYFKDKSVDDDRCIVDAVIFAIRANGFLVYIPRYALKGPVYLQDSQVRLHLVQHIDHSLAQKLSDNQVVTLATICSLFWVSKLDITYFVGALRSPISVNTKKYALKWASLARMVPLNTLSVNAP